MKLLTAPGFIRVGREARDWNLLDGPLLSVKSHPNPVPILSGVTKCSVVRCRNFVTVISILIRIVVTIATAEQCRFGRSKTHSTMFRVTGHTTNPGRRVRRDHCRYEGFSRVA